MDISLSQMGLVVEEALCPLTNDWVDFDDEIYMNCERYWDRLRLADKSNIQSFGGHEETAIAVFRDLQSSLQMFMSVLRRLGIPEEESRDQLIWTYRTLVEFVLFFLYESTDYSLVTKSRVYEEDDYLGKRMFQLGRLQKSFLIRDFVLRKNGSMSRLQELDDRQLDHVGAHIFEGERLLDELRKFDMERDLQIRPERLAKVLLLNCGIFCIDKNELVKACRRDLRAIVSPEVLTSKSVALTKAYSRCLKGG